ncbi:MAG: hypothetical protein QE263_09615 [Vampirovibrionales bacterium]|nr:hypothetical protein [Vampirovibrionales bacterium]
MSAPSSHAVHLFVGEDTGRRDGELKAMRDKVVSPAMEALCYKRLISPTLAEVTEAVEQVSMALGNVQWIEIDGFAPFANAIKDDDAPDLESLKASLENVDATQKRVVFISDKFDRKLKLPKWLASQSFVTVHEFKALAFFQTKEAEVALITAAKAEGITVTPPAAHALVEAYGVLLQPLLNEARKLAVYTNGQPITPQAVAALCTHTDNLFEMLNDWFHQRSGGNGLAILHEALQRKAPQLVWALLANQVEYAFMLRYLQRHRYHETQLAERLGKKPGKISIDLRQLEGVSYERLKHLRLQVTTLEQAFKTGQLSPDLALDTLLCQ